MLLRTKQYSQPVGHAIEIKSNTGCIAVVQIVPDLAIQASIANKAYASHFKKRIHGERFMTHIADIQPPLDRYEKKYLLELADIFRGQAQQTKVCPSDVYLVDQSIVFTPAGSKYQMWHLDDMKHFLGVNFNMFGERRLTQFAAVPYTRLGDNDEQRAQTMQAYALPLDWDEIQAADHFDHLNGMESLATIFFRTVSTAARPQAQPRTEACLTV